MKRTEVQLIGAALCWSMIGSASAAPIYEYRFNLNNKLYVVDSQEEVEQIVESAGESYSVLKVTQEIELTETTTLLKYRAPPVDPPAGLAYRYYTERVYDGENLMPSLAEAEDEMSAKLVAAGYAAPARRYSGTTRDGHPFFAYSDPRLPIAGNIVVHDNDPVSTSCSDYAGRGAISYGSPNGVVTYSPLAKHGTVCEVHGDTKWVLTWFHVDQIMVFDGFLCPVGYGTWWVPFADWCKNYRQVDVYRKQLVTCSVEPLVPLETLIAQYHPNDPEMAQLTRDQEANVDLPLRDKLTEGARQAEACVQSRFDTEGFSYQLTSTGRPLAYQAHFYDLMQKWQDHGNVDKDSAEWEACAERREQVELEVGKRVGAGNREWNAPGGRFHQIVQAAEPSSSQHAYGKAFDVSGVDAVKNKLAKDSSPVLTVQDWVNRPADCNVGWGGLYNKPDDVHFYLREGEQPMDFMTLMATLLASTVSEFPPEVHHGEPQLARLLVSGEHVGDEVVYHYTVVNQHPEEELIELLLGVDYENGGAIPDLVEKPVGTQIIIEPDPQQLGSNRFWADMPDSAWTAPLHWYVGFIKMEYFPRYYLKLRRNSSAFQASVGEIEPGQQLDGFSVRLPEADPTYYEAGFEASFYRPAGHYFGYPEKLDVQAPQLTLTALKHNNVWPPNNKMVEVSVDVQVSDDYDSRPLVKLVSITANEPWDASDIEDADFGQDDRNFKLRASRSGSSPEGRVYTITYSAEDAFGHVTERSVTVTIPHDRR